MIDINQTTNVNGAVKLEVDGEIKQVAFLAATIGVDGKLTSNRAIQDFNMFEQYKEEVEKDFAAFDSYVYAEALETRKKWEEMKQKEGNADAESA